MEPQRPDALAYLTGALSHTPYPSGISLPGQGGKFDTSGGVQIWRGNTFVCHVSRPSDSYAALVELQETIKKSPFARFYTFLPPLSFHMTVFQGYSPRDGLDDAWPIDISRDTGPDTSTGAFVERLAGVELPRFRARPTGLYAGNSVTMAGASAHHEAELRTARQTLRDITGIRPSDFETYVFHITLGYLVHWVSPTTAREIIGFSDDIGAAFCTATPEVELDPCAFCTFDSMHHFEPVAVLGR